MSVISVAINPGATALTVIPLLPSSFAADMVSPSHSGFGSSVVGLSGVPRTADNRGNIDDAAALFGAASVMEACFNTIQKYPSD